MPRALSWAGRFELRQYLKGSLWVLPLLGGLLGTVLAQVALLVDGAVRLPSAWNYSASTASGVLTAIVGAMIALIGFVVTIGVVVVQQATGTLSPRYMRLWYRDRLQKAVLATFAGTFTFAYSLLRRVEDDHVPDVGVTMAGIAVAASIGLLLIYLDRFTHNLRPVAVAALVGRSGQQVLAARSRSSAGMTPCRLWSPTSMRRSRWCSSTGPAPCRRSTSRPWSPWRSGTPARSCSPARSASS